MQKEKNQSHMQHKDLRRTCKRNFTKKNKKITIVAQKHSHKAQNTNTPKELSLFQKIEPKNKFSFIVT